MSRHKFVKTLDLDDELDDYDGVAIFKDDEGECVRAPDVAAPICARPVQTDAIMEMSRPKIKVISWTL